jgi:predicted chitinase
MPEPMRFDHTKFFDLYRKEFGSLNPAKISGIENLLIYIERDPEVNDVRWAAYMMATVKHECADKWQPIEEYGKGVGKPYGKKVKVKGSDGKDYLIAYYGRGYVQLTWKEVYGRMSHALGLGDDLLVHPERVMEPEISYSIMSYGMRKGFFTGKKLADFIHDQICDYKNARKIINGLDKWALIKGYAEKFESFFTLSRIS